MIEVFVAIIVYILLALLLFRLLFNVLPILAYIVFAPIIPFILGFKYIKSEHKTDRIIGVAIIALWSLVWILLTFAYIVYVKS